MRVVLACFYSHPWAWNEIGFGGPAYPRGYSRFGSPELQRAERETWEGAEHYRPRPRQRTSASHPRNDPAAGSLIKGVTRMPTDNDSAWLLAPPPARPAEPRPDAPLRPVDAVDLVVVGAGAGGVTLAQRLARPAGAS